MLPILYCIIVTVIRLVCSQAFCGVNQILLMPVAIRVGGIRETAVGGGDVANSIAAGDGRTTSWNRK